MRIRDWLDIIGKFRIRGIKVIHISSLEAVTNMNKRSLSVALTRLEGTGLIRRVAKGWVCIQPCEVWDVVKVVFPSSYISLEWALHYHGILDQETHAVTVVWLGKPKLIRSRHYVFEIHRIKPQLYFGFDSNMIAEPEKAFLDTLYLRRRLPIIELNLDNLDWGRISKYLERYPKTIQKYIDRNILSVL